MNLKWAIETFPNRVIPYTLFLLILSSLVFAVDLVTPYGTIYWLFYLLPLYLAFKAKKTICPVIIICTTIIFSIVGAIMTGRNPLLKEILLFDLINRFEGMLAFGFFTYIIIKLKFSTDILAAEKDRLAVTLKSIGDAVIVVDTRGTIDTMNNVAEDLTGWKLQEAFGKPLLSVFHIVNEETRKLCEDPVRKVLTSGKIVELANHTILISRDGSERVIADSAAPIIDLKQRTIGVVLVFRDVTEKQKIIDTMHRTSKLDSLGVLAGGIAHDFNNLMGGIFGYIDLANDESDRKKASVYLAKALETIGRARGLTHQLLTFAKGGAPIQKITSMVPFIEETTFFVLHGSNSSCRFDLPKNLWSCNIDKAQICQAIDNILINALQAMPTGGSIDLSAKNISIGKNEHISLSAGNYVQITIKDYGIGIPKEFLPRIFDPFFTTKPEGHGLGLATCYSIVSRHDGAIDVESIPEKGTTFSIFLPAIAESVQTEEAQGTPMHKGNGSIIVMDDEEVIRDTLSNMLKGFGYSVICKNDGDTTLEYFIEETNAGQGITALILDLTIPGKKGGKEVAEEIRKINKEIPIFIASGYAQDPLIKNPAQFGFTASICKPFTMTELSEMLNRFLTPKQGRR